MIRNFNVPEEIDSIQVRKADALNHSGFDPDFGAAT